MKPLLPTLKERKRYILVKVISSTEIQKSDLVETVAKAGLQFLGELGLAKSGMQFLPETYDTKTKTGIIRVNHKYTDEVRAALTLVKEIGKKKVTIKSEKTSGTISKLKR